MTRKTADSLRKTLKGISLSLLPLSFNLVGILAGSILAFYHAFITANPWALVVYPGILSIRGAIGGMYAGRLGTALHIGTIKPTIRGNTRESSTLLSSIATLTLLSGLVLSAVTSLFLYLFAGATPHEVILSVLIIIATMATSVLVISPITFLISVYSFRKGLDPDVVVYPIVSTVADVIITVFYIVMIKGALSNYLMIAIADLLYVSVVVVVVLRNYRDAEYVRTIREFVITLVIVSIVVNITGLALEGFTKRSGSRGRSSRSTPRSSTPSAM